MSDRPKARFTAPLRARDITAAALGTLFALISAGRSRAATHPQGPGLMGAQHAASPTRSGREVTSGGPIKRPNRLLFLQDRRFAATSPLSRQNLPSIFLLPYLPDNTVSPNLNS